MGPSSKRVAVAATWAFAVLGVSAQDWEAGAEAYEYVDPLIGTINGGELDCKWEICFN